MNLCPKCGQVYTDEGLRFCLMDGTPLVAGESQATVVIPQAVSTETMVSRPRRKRSPLLWVIAALLVLLVGGAALVGLLLYAYKLGNESALTNKPAANSSTPARTPTTSKQSAAATPAATPASNAEPSPADADADMNEDVQPIAWSTSASLFKQDVGRTYTFMCPREGTAQIVWGSDVYTTDSSICTAAVHAGLITLEGGGEVTIEFKGGRQVYGSTTRNGITSYTYGEYPHSFIFKQN